jgi:hypothetical protein
MRRRMYIGICHMRRRIHDMESLVRLSGCKED